MHIKKLTEVFNKIINEELRLADHADPDLFMGVMYMVDTKQELIDGLEKLTLGDSIGIIQGKQEVTITLEDVNNYSFILDNGNSENNWELEDNGPVFKDMSKIDIIKLIQLSVK